LKRLASDVSSRTSAGRCVDVNTRSNSRIWRQTGVFANLICAIARFYKPTSMVLQKVDGKDSRPRAGRLSQKSRACWELAPGSESHGKNAVCDTLSRENDFTLLFFSNSRSTNHKLQTKGSLLVACPSLSQSVQENSQEHDADTGGQSFAHVGGIHCVENLFA